MHPEQNNRSPTLIACEYGPIAAGACGVDTTESEGWVVATVDDILLRCGFDEMIDGESESTPVVGSWILV